MSQWRVEYDPSDPNGRSDAAATAHMNMMCSYFIGFGSFGAAVYFLCSLVSVLKGSFSAEFLLSLAFLIAMAVIDFFFFFSTYKAKEKRHAAKKYFLFFFGGAVAVSAVVAILFSIHTLRLSGDGITLFVFASATLLFVVFLVYLINRKLSGLGPIIWLADRRLVIPPPNCTTKPTKADMKESSSPPRHIFCHKCGTNLPDDSVFCCQCGAKLR